MCDRRLGTRHLPLTAFAGVRYPYLQLRRSEIPGLVRELKTRDYRTMAIHPNGGAFWNRNDAFRALGFDRFIDGDTFSDAERHGHYVSDAALVDRIIAEMDDAGSPQMIMVGHRISSRRSAAGGSICCSLSNSSVRVSRARVVEFHSGGHA